jgi:glycosyltransferase involved in cell wall biosynthesis
MSPVFSIVIPTYNRANFIGKTLKSILLQDFTDFEVLVVDDGSKDDTETVVKNFMDPRIQYFKKENGERGAARNYGAKRSSGTYINFFDSDDLMYPNHLKTALSVIAQYSNPEFLHLAYDYRLEDGTLIKAVNNFNEKTFRLLPYDNILSCNGVLVRKDIAMRFPFEENRVLASSEDWELWIRLYSRFKPAYSNTITSTVVSHNQRSLFTIAPEKAVARDLCLIRNLQQDPEVLKLYGASLNRFIAQRYTFFMLLFTEAKQKKEVLQWSWKAFKIFPLIILSKRFLASIKNMVLQ